MTISVGEQIQASPGVWNEAPTSYSYQWQDSLDGSNVNATLAGETRSDYIVGAGEAGRWLRVQTVASNAAGDSDPVYSAWYGPVVAPDVDPDPEPEPGTPRIYGVAVVDGKPVLVLCRPN